MKKIKPTRLYIKQHSITKKKYLGKSIKLDIDSYFGSGKRWLNHINKHGKEYVITLWVSDWFTSKEKILELSIFLSKSNNIVESEEWLNLKEETGTDGGILPNYALKSISEKLKGRTKETHEYIKISAEKKSKTMKDVNSVYQKIARPKIKKWLDNLSKEERKEKLGHIVSDEQKLKLSLCRLGKTKNNCDRVKKMSNTKKQYYSNLSNNERKLKLGHSKGMKWYHNDELKLCKTFFPVNVINGWILGRKKYEN
jgi:hypothetical protein